MGLRSYSCLVKPAGHTGFIPWAIRVERGGFVHFIYVTFLLMTGFGGSDVKVKLCSLRTGADPLYN